MKISEVIKQLGQYKEIFGDIDVCSAKYIEQQTRTSYSRKMILNDAKVVVGGFGNNGEDVIIINEF